MCTYLHIHKSYMRATPARHGALRQAAAEPPAAPFKVIIIIVLIIMMMVNK